MAKYVYIVESSTEKSKFGYKVFSSEKAAKRLTKELPELKHKIIKYELLNMNSF